MSHLTLRSCSGHRLTEALARHVPHDGAGMTEAMAAATGKLGTESPPTTTVGGNRGAGGLRCRWMRGLEDRADGGGVPHGCAGDLDSSAPELVLA